MIAAELLAPSTLWLGAGVYAGALLWAAWRAPWLEVLSDSRRQHLLFGTVLGLFLLWLVRRDFDSGVSFHFIGMTVVTLLLDWPLALQGGWGGHQKGGINRMLGPIFKQQRDIKDNQVCITGRDERSAVVGDQRMDNRFDTRQTATALLAAAVDFLWIGADGQLAHTFPPIS